uniref:Reverse transcriptase domain-containing protein n=1 Tax=Cannabis sativa TaxID=3483 RepID=A0A803PRY6_CANSA
MINKPLPRGRMISLPKVRDEFWIDFRYERLLEFCFECGILGHPFEKCIKFMERMDNGNDDDLPYGPWMKGSKLPSTGYDKYRTDFSKGNAWPLLTRLARTTLTSTIPRLNNIGPPQPPYLTAAESLSAPIIPQTPLSHPTTISSHSTIPLSTLNTTLPPPSTILHSNKSPPIPITSPITSQHRPASDMQHHQHFVTSSPTVPPPTSSTHFDMKTDNSLFVTNLPGIFTPDIGSASRPFLPIATYPPTLTPSPFKSASFSAVHTAIPPSVSTSSIVIAASNKENYPTTPVAKRQNDTLSMRQFLKRCRNHNASSFLVGENSSQNVSYDDMDSDGFIDDSNSVSRFPQTLNFAHGLESPRSGLSGGLLLLWHQNIDVTLLNFGKTFFDCYVKADNEATFHLTAFYGALDAQNKPDSWMLLQRLADVSPSLPWLVIGDFNEILSNENKSGGCLRNEQHMEAFRKTLDHCKLHEMLFEGDPFTWIKNRSGVSTIKSRLDWCFVNHHWENHFQAPGVLHLDYFSSDHRAISASFAPINSRLQHNQRRSQFRFEKLWLSDDQCKDIIAASWKSSSTSNPISAVLGNLDECVVNLQKWHFEKYGNMKRRITDAQLQVETLNNSPHRTPAAMNSLKNSESLLDELLEQEEIYWQQRSRVDWLQVGDRNTKFFHAKASARKSNNTIKFLLDENGNRVSSKSELAAAIHDYFAEIFTASTLDEVALVTTLNTIPSTVIAEMNATLLTPFEATEVEAALHSMAPDKSPGIDGMSPMFYQHNWDVVGHLVTAAVLSVLNDGADPTSLNKTLITLIPMIKKPQRLQDFCPISLCNVISKLVTKVLVNRFKHVLPYVISESQSAFLPNRLITDNVLVAFELVNAIKNKTLGRKGVASLKLDMSKAFDRVEWSFIERVMGKMGFASDWIRLIMSCLRANRFSFILNGEVTRSLLPSKGLCQGCPLSPYLFLIYSEALSRLLQHEEEVGHLNDFKLTRHAPSISHLFFADDSLLFCQANESSCLAIKRSLDIYHKASGQVLNSDKSVMSFSPNTTLAAQVFFHRHLNMPICECHERYLGLPSYSGRDKKRMFSDIKEKIWRLMHTWSEKFFSAGGREVLLKAVVQSIPTYAMSRFRLPVYFCNQLESMMANFWWGLNENGNTIHWRSWKLLCKRKTVAVLKSRYYPNNDFLQANVGHSPSLTWQGIHWGRSLLIAGLRWKIGEGCRINCADDPWIPGHSTFRPYHFSRPPDTTVSNLITEERQWDLALLNQWFSSLDVDRILTIPLSFFRYEDTLAWNPCSSGIYSVQTAYHLAASLAETDDSSSSSASASWWNFLLSLSLPQKIKIFIWRAFNDALHVATALVVKVCFRSVWRHLDITHDWNTARLMHKGDYLVHLSSLAPSGALIPTRLLRYLASLPQISPAAPLMPWTPPPLGMLKMNVDAVVDSSQKITGIGALIRSSNGEVVAAISKPVLGCFASHEMEAIAMFHCLNWAIQLQLRRSALLKRMPFKFQMLYANLHQLFLLFKI